MTETNKTTEAAVEPVGRDKALLNCLLQTAWAMEPLTLERLTEVVMRHASGVKLSVEQIEQITAASKKTPPAPKRTYEMIGATAVIGIQGVIEKHASAVSDISLGAGTSVDEISDQIHRALADEAVRDILLRIESPGGSVAGIADLADEIYAAGAVKPVIAFAEDQAASAAYYLGSQASRFYANQSAGVGSIGVYAVLVDSSRAAENQGLKVHVVKAGEFKAAGVRGTHITEEQLDTYQDEINAHYEMFVAAVARGRGVSIEDARALADGRVHIGLRAVEAGLIDGVKTLRQALTSAKPSVRTLSAKAMDGGSMDTPKRETKPKEQTNMSEQDKDIDAAVAEAKQAERARMAGIEAALGGVEGLEAVREKALTSDMTIEAVKASAYDALLKVSAQKLTERDEQIQTLQAEKEKLAKVLAAKGVNASELGEFEASDQQKPEPGSEPGSGSETGTSDGSEQAVKDDGKATTYDARVKALIAPDKSKGRAMVQAMKELPTSYETWAKQQPQPATK